jgi:hypothetical protein
MAQLTSLARTTIIVSWLMVGLAFFSTTMHSICLLRIRKNKPSVSDICVWVALFFGIILVAQTTWAIADEGSGKHQWDILQQNVLVVAKVRREAISYGHLTDIIIVLDRQRDLVVYLWRFDSRFWLPHGQMHLQCFR